MSKVTLVSLLFGLAVLGTLIYSTMGLRGYSCEVCMTFEGRTQCAKASGTTKEEAQRTATDTACAPISSGMTESIQCSNTPPDKVTWF
ncbi:MAG: hypothetical protein GC160_06345 [Acidobacteria bacterium]|nr:hypothetical protein [Acidobacteriota bacterium]